MLTVLFILHIMHKKGLFVFGCILIFYLTSFILLHRTTPPGLGWTQVLSSDGRGYYSYLPKLFLEHNLNYTAKDYPFCVKTNKGKLLNRLYCGTAVLETPFFLGACVYAKLTGQTVDGYSKPFAYAIALAAIFYFLAGLRLLFSILTKYQGIHPRNALLTILFVAVGTNVLYYTVWSSAFSHVFSFFMVTTFVYQCYKVIEQPRFYTVLLVGFCLGLVIIIRPVNVLIVLIVPALFTNFAALKTFFVKTISTKNSIAFLTGLILPLTIQAFIWYAQTGNFIEWSYKQEGFNFTQPKMWDVLFGFRRGLFVYCPILLLSLLGYFSLYRNNKWQAIWLGVFLLVFTWVTASWWHWSYGDTFGLRPFNDILSVFALLLALVFSYKQFRLWILLVCIVFSFLNMVFSWQFITGITNVSTMNAQKFTESFLKISPSFINMFGGCNDLTPYAPNGFNTLYSKQHTFNTYPNGVLTVHDNHHVLVDSFIFPEKHHLARHFWIKIGYKKHIQTPTAMRHVLFVFDATDPKTDSLKIRYTFRVKETLNEATNTWQNHTHFVWIPLILDGNELIKTYFYNPKNERFFIDNYSITIQIPRW